MYKPVWQLCYREVLVIVTLRHRATTIALQNARRLRNVEQIQLSVTEERWPLDVDACFTDCAVSNVANLEIRAVRILFSSLVSVTHRIQMHDFGSSILVTRHCFDSGGIVSD